jgi:uncharacterized protein YecE (DUF72 family)
MAVDDKTNDETNDKPAEKLGAVRIGTCAFTAAGWPGAFYPAGLQPRDFLTYYATQFDSVEVDSTFYHAPPARTVEGWRLKTPDDFVFAAKVPQIVTHEKCLRDCDAEFREFVAVMEILGPKLGPMLLQFPYFNQSDFETCEDFYLVLIPFLKKLPREHQFALEIRNKQWLDARFADTLREYNVALALQDQSWMPLPTQMKFDYVTADFTYVRLLGDRKGIEKQTKVWDKVIVERAREIWHWVDVCATTVRRGAATYVYVNNHFAGHAPTTVREFQRLWNAKGMPELGAPRPLPLPSPADADAPAQSNAPRAKPARAKAARAPGKEPTLFD